MTQPPPPLRIRVYLSIHRGVVDNKHSTDIASTTEPPLPLRVYMSIRRRVVGNKHSTDVASTTQPPPALHHPSAAPPPASVWAFTLKFTTHALISHPVLVLSDPAARRTGRCTAGWSGGHPCSSTSSETSPTRQGCPPPPLLASTTAVSVTQGITQNTLSFKPRVGSGI